MIPFSIKVVVRLQTKRHKMYCLFLLICLMASFICFDNFKTDDMMCFFGATNESKQIITVAYSISNEDVCTVEMLGHTHNSLLTQQTAKHNCETQRKSETLLERIDNSASLQSLFKFFTSVNANICILNTDAAEIIIFIHNKDGKKRI